MAPHRVPGPVCRTKDCYQGVEDGTLARVPSSRPTVIGTTTARTSPIAPAHLVASGGCSFLNPRARGTVIAPEEAFDRLRRNSPAPTISPPQAKTAQTWPDGSSSAALEQEIQIGNQKIKVIRPTDDQARGKNLPTTSQLAEALRAVPDGQRAHSHTVIISPRPAPGSTPTQTIAGQAGSGEIDLFPVDQTQSQQDFDNRLMHESGHNYQETLWHGAQDVQEWQEAANADNRRPSPYAANNTGDDFCEFGILYNTAKGTACEATARQMYPNRWQKRAAY